MDEFEAFDARIPANAEDRAQIAGVTIHWSYLELTVERLIAKLEGRDGEVRYEKGIDSRITTLKQLLKGTSVFPDETAAKIRAIASEILRTRDRRDRVVHGLWILAPSGRLDRSFHPLSKTETIAPLDGEAIRQIKLHIIGLYELLTVVGDLKSPITFYGKKRGQTKGQRQRRMSK